MFVFFLEILRLRLFQQKFWNYDLLFVWCVEFDWGFSWWLNFRSNFIGLNFSSACRQRQHGGTIKITVGDRYVIIYLYNNCYICVKHCYLKLRNTERRNTDMYGSVDEHVLHSYTYRHVICLLFTNNSIIASLTTRWPANRGGGVVLYWWEMRRLRRILVINDSRSLNDLEYRKIIGNSQKLGKLLKFKIQYLS